MSQGDLSVLGKLGWINAINPPNHFLPIRAWTRTPQLTGNPSVSCHSVQTEARGPSSGRGEPFLVDGDLWDSSGSLLMCWTLDPRRKGHRAVWGGCPPALGKAHPFHAASPIPEMGFLAGKGGGRDTLPKLCSRPCAQQPPIPTFSSCCCRCNAPRQRNGESTSVGKISETTCVSATESTAALDGVK